MLLGTLQTLEEKVVCQLARKPHASVDWICKQLHKNGEQPCTVQAIYRVLRELQKKGVITKIGREYKIAMPWINSLRGFYKHLESTYSSELEIAHLLPGDQSSRCWNFSNLHALDDFWDDLTLTLLADSTCSLLYEWCPHSWFKLTAPVKWKRREQALTSQQIERLSLIGGRTALDFASQSDDQSPNHSRFFLGDECNFSRTSYITVIDPYVVTIRLSEESAQKIEQFYLEHQCLTATTNEQLYKLLYSLEGGVLQLERCPDSLRHLLHGFRSLGISTSRKVCNSE